MHQRQPHVVLSSKVGMQRQDSSELSIVVPVFNGASTLRACLDALLRATGPSREIIVVDDASKDNSVEIAIALGVRPIQFHANRGCTDARNEGANHARSPILVFVDCDVVVHPDALERIYRFFSENAEYTAIFGSYDARPGAPHFVSQYRNLLHHFTHQNEKSKTETFWTGLGAVRRSAFEHVGGFRREYGPIEDVAFGLELAERGFRIALEPRLMGTHLKRWTLYSMIKTDIFDRAVPWSTMILNRRRFTNALNTSAAHKLSVIATMLCFLCLIMSLMFYQLIYVSAFCLLVMIATNLHIIRYYIKEKGLFFGIGVIPLHFIHQLCAGLGFALAAGKYAILSLSSFFDRSRRTLRKLVARHPGGI
jgi:glycosyltransferase involved in cell wall biosynthesis